MYFRVIIWLTLRKKDHRIEGCKNPCDPRNLLIQESFLKNRTYQKANL